MRRAHLVYAAMLALGMRPPPVAAQAVYERGSLDTTVALDFFRGDNVSNRPQIVVDATATAQLGRGWQAFFRPWFRLARPAPPTATPPGRGPTLVWAL